MAPPGVYNVILTVEGRSYRQTIAVNTDPRSPASFADLHSQYHLQMSLYQCIQEAWNGYNQVVGTRSVIEAILKTKPPSEVLSVAGAVDSKLVAICGSPGFARQFGGGLPSAGAAPRQPTFAAINGMAVRQLNILDSGDMAPTAAMRKACAATCTTIEKTMASWGLLKRKDLSAFNALLEKNSLKPIGNLQEMALPRQ